MTNIGKPSENYQLKRLEHDICGKVTFLSYTLDGAGTLSHHSVATGSPAVAPLSEEWAFVRSR